jgi:Mg2+ and Co2+ transporter CorA
MQLAVGLTPPQRCVEILDADGYLLRCFNKLGKMLLRAAELSMPEGEFVPPRELTQLLQTLVADGWQVHSRSGDNVAGIVRRYREITRTSDPKSETIRVHTVTRSESGRKGLAYALTDGPESLAQCANARAGVAWVDIGNWQENTVNQVSQYTGVPKESLAQFLAEDKRRVARERGYLVLGTLVFLRRPDPAKSTWRIEPSPVDILVTPNAVITFRRSELPGFERAMARLRLLCHDPEAAAQRISRPVRNATPCTGALLSRILEQCVRDSRDALNFIHDDISVLEEARTRQGGRLYARQLRLLAQLRASLGSIEETLKALKDTKEGVLWDENLYPSTRDKSTSLEELFGRFSSQLYPALSTCAELVGKAKRLADDEIARHKEIFERWTGAGQALGGVLAVGLSVWPQLLNGGWKWGITLVGAAYVWHGVRNMFKLRGQPGATGERE